MDHLTIAYLVILAQIVSSAGLAYPMYKMATHKRNLHFNEKDIFQTIARLWPTVTLLIVILEATCLFPGEDPNFYMFYFWAALWLGGTVAKTGYELLA